MQKNDCKNRRAQVVDLRTRLSNLKEKQKELEAKQLNGDRSDETRRNLDSVILSIDFTENRIAGIDANKTRDWLPEFSLNAQSRNRINAN